MPSSPTSTAKPGRGKDGVPSRRNGNGDAFQPVPTASQSDGQSRPTYEQIAQRAYEIYEREGRQDGHELENWLKAEAELRTSSFKTGRS
jgi:hypothetical protein